MKEYAPKHKDKGIRSMTWADRVKVEAKKSARAIAIGVCLGLIVWLQSDSLWWGVFVAGIAPNAWMTFFE